MLPSTSHQTKKTTAHCILHDHDHNRNKIVVKIINIAHYEITSKWLLLPWTVNLLCLPCTKVIIIIVIIALLYRIWDVGLAPPAPNEESSPSKTKPSAFCYIVNTNTWKQNEHNSHKHSRLVPYAYMALQVQLLVLCGARKHRHWHH